MNTEAVKKPRTKAHEGGKFPCRDAETACATGCIWWYNGRTSGINVVRGSIGGGWVNRTPFLVGTPVYKTGPGTDQLASRRLHGNGIGIRDNVVTVVFCGEDVENSA